MTNIFYDYNTFVVHDAVIVWFLRCDFKIIELYIFIHWRGTSAYQISIITFSPQSICADVFIKKFNRINQNKSGNACRTFADVRAWM